MGWFGRKSAAGVRPFVPAWLGSGEEAGFVRSYDAQYDEVFRNNPVGQRCVRLVAGMVGGLAVHATEGDEQATGLMKEDGLLEQIAAALLLHGNAYVQLIAAVDDKPAELCAMRPERVSIATDEFGYPAAYLYRAGGRTVRIAARDALTRRQVAHIRALSPGDDHYDPARDYQSGLMRASAGSSGRRQVHVDFPAVIEAGAAKGLAQSALARQWARRERLTLRLSPEYLDLTPGDVVRLPSGTQDWRVERATVEQMVVVAELKRVWREAGASAAEAGRAIGSHDVIAPPTAIALFDLPDLGVTPSQQPVLHLAAASGAREWRPVPVEISVNGLLSTGQTAIGETDMGTVITVPASGQAALIDELATLEVELVGDAMWLMNCDDLALSQGTNLAIAGDELIQFGRAEPIAPRRFRLSRLLRGRRGTEWAMGSHVTGESFAMIEDRALRAVDLPLVALGASVLVQARGLGDGETGAVVSRVAGGETLRPPSPVHLMAERRSDSGLDLGWVRRSRSGWAWLDSVDAPIGETVERYHVRLSGAAGTIEFESTVASASLSAAEVAALGAGSAIIAITQIGDLAASREATLTFLIA